MDELKFIDLYGNYHVKDESEPVSFRPGVYAFVENSEGNILMILDKRSIGFWEIPGGALKIGEDYIEAMVREVQEETGYTIALNSEQPIYLDYDIARYLNGNFHHEINVFYSGIVDETKQGVQNFDVTDDEEILEVKFCTEEELGKLNIIPFQRKALQYYLDNRKK